MSACLGSSFVYRCFCVYTLGWPSDPVIGQYSRNSPPLVGVHHLSLVQKSLTHRTMSPASHCLCKALPTHWSLVTQSCLLLHLSLSDSRLLLGRAVQNLHLASLEMPQTPSVQISTRCSSLLKDPSPKQHFPFPSCRRQPCQLPSQQGEPEPLSLRPLLAPCQPASQLHDSVLKWVSHQPCSFSPWFCRSLRERSTQVCHKGAWGSLENWDVWISLGLLKLEFQMVMRTYP